MLFKTPSSYDNCASTFQNSKKPAVNMNSTIATMVTLFGAACLLPPACVGRSEIKTEKEKAPPPTAQNEEDATGRVTITIPDLEPYQPDDAEAQWLAIDRIAEGADGAWATGGVFAENRVVIRTENVARFRVHLDRLPVNWDRRVVLRIDGRPSELTRKHYPTLTLQRSPTGGWIPVEPDETENP
jgi:hypothetical protein